MLTYPFFLLFTHEETSQTVHPKQIRPSQLEASNASRKPSNCSDQAGAHGSDSSVFSESPCPIHSFQCEIRVFPSEMAEAHAARPCRKAQKQSCTEAKLKPKLGRLSPHSSQTLQRPLLHRHPQPQQPLVYALHPERPHRTRPSQPSTKEQQWAKGI